MGIKNQGAWNAGLDRFAKSIDTKGVLFQKKMAFLVLGGAVLLASGQILPGSGLLQLTPVDTAFAVGNWQVTLGAPATGTVAAGSQSSRGEANRGPAVAAVTGRASRALAALKLGQSIFIANNAPYILVLNDGGVNRVAHHMVERAIANARASVRA